MGQLLHYEILGIGMGLLVAHEQRRSDPSVIASSCHLGRGFPFSCEMQMARAFPVTPQKFLQPARVHEVLHAFHSVTFWEKFIPLKKEASTSR
jgi:hypothetical protein